MSAMAQVLGFTPLPHAGDVRHNDVRLLRSVSGTQRPRRTPACQPRTDDRLSGGA